MLRFILIAFLLCCIPGCAVFNRENTRALNFVEAKLVPSDPFARKLSYPLTIPASLAAVTFDMFILHPVSVIPDAIDDAKELGWEKMDWKKHYFTSSAALTPCAALTPLTFTGSFLLRSTFDMPHRTQRPDTGKAEEERLLSDAQKALREERFDDALRQAEEIIKKSPHRAEAREVLFSVLLEKMDIERLASQRMPLQWNNAVEKRYVRALATASSEDRVGLLFLIDRRKFYDIRPTRGFLQAIINVLRDDDRAVRMKALSVLGNYAAEPSVQAAFKEIVAQGDPVLAAEAALLIQEKK